MLTWPTAEWLCQLALGESYDHLLTVFPLSDVQAVELVAGKGFWSHDSEWNGMEVREEEEDGSMIVNWNGEVGGLVTLDDYCLLRECTPEVGGG